MDNYLLKKTEETKAYLEKIDRMLESKSEDNILLALEILRGGGVPEKYHQRIYNYFIYSEFQSVSESAKQIYLEINPHFLKNHPFINTHENIKSIEEIKALLKAPDITGNIIKKISHTRRYYDAYKFKTAYQRLQKIGIPFDRELIQELLSTKQKKLMSIEYGFNDLLIYEQSLWYEFKSDGEFRIQEPIYYIPEQIESYEEWRNLETIDLGGNFLTYLPSAIKALKKVKNIHLKFNHIEILPKEIGELELLEELSLESNALKFLPPEIGLLKKLKILGLRNIKTKESFRDKITNNELDCLPKEIGNLENLQLLDVANNKLQYLPEEIGKLNNLENLSMAGNQLSFLPKNIGNLTSLISLSLKNNLMVDLPTEIAGLINLEYLNLEHNQLSSFPLIITKIMNLKRLFIGHNDFTHIPKEIKNLKNLSELDLTGSRLSEEIKNMLFLSLPNTKITF